ncbi:hypothetical protein [Sporosarcina sp. YIM B06819]|uniref:hypothetical protein n=1 Tax=Sporosarcina sp. YIM B06819 TaxID=3081769 RepID=UPI00298D4233|nr:hypothetical protein [Sporosarcina sp. YIM B06819]
MNEGGYSWPEAILTLAVVMVIFGTLLPLASTMTTKLQMKKLQMYAAETALQGAIYFKAYGWLEGNRQENGIDFDWTIEGQAVCVRYKIVDKAIEKCVNQ